MAPFIKKYIITGAPGTGKTTLINALEKEHPCLHEVSRKVIIDEQESGGTGMPWKDLSKFAALVYEASITELTSHPQALFTDRSMLDLIAYLKVEDLSIPDTLARFSYLDTFQQRVFFAPTWKDIYHKDEQRLQTFDYCLELEKALKKTYSEKGFDLIKLPKDTVANRLHFINSFLKK